MENRRTLLWLLILFLTASAASAAVTAPVEAMDLFRISLVTDPLVAPNAKRLLYTRRFFDLHTDRALKELWLADIRGDGSLDPRLLVSAADKPSYPIWSPDSKSVAFVALSGGSPQVHIMSLATGIARAITSGKDAPGNLAWSRDGRFIAFTALVKAPRTEIKGMPKKPEGASWAPEPRIITDFVYRTDADGYVIPGYRHVFVVSVDNTSAPKQITSGDFDHSIDGGIDWTADGKGIVVSSHRLVDRDLRPRDSNLYVLPVAGGEARQLTYMDGKESTPSVSPDGKSVAYLAEPENSAFYSQKRIFVVPLAGGPSIEVAAGLDRETDRPHWSADGNRIAFLYYDRGMGRIGEVSKNGGKVSTQAVKVGGTRLYVPYSGTSVSCAQNTCAYTTLESDRPAGLGISRGGKEIVTYNPNADWREGKKIGRMEEIIYPSGPETIQGWLQYPTDFDESKQYPLVLEIHGGPNTDYGPNFSLTHALFAARGYFVLFINPRGSIGYGERFANLIDKNYPGNDYDDLMAGVDQMLKRPYIDARNLFISGGSAGGLMTTHAIAKTNRFRAAVALRPVTDWAIQVLTSDIQAFTKRYWMGDVLPWEQHEAYSSRSPLAHVANVKTPLLLITGESDYRTPIAHTEAYYQALKFRGIETVMVRLPEAGHSMGRPSQWLQSVLLAVDWFDKHRVN